MQCHAIPCKTMQYHTILWNTKQYHAIPCIINNCWRSVPLPCGQYNGHFLLSLNCGDRGALVGDFSPSSLYYWWWLYDRKGVLFVFVYLYSEATVLVRVQIVAKQVSLENSFPRSLSEVEGRGWWDGYLHNLPLSVSIVAALCKSSLNEDIVVVHIIIVNVSWQQHIIKSKLQPTSNKIVTMCIDHKKPRTKNEGPLFQKISLCFIGEVYFSGHLQVWSLKKGPPKRMDCVKWGD